MWRQDQLATYGLVAWLALLWLLLLWQTTSSPHVPHHADDEGLRTHLP